MKLVLVEWHDAHDGSEGWIREENVSVRPRVIKSVGWIIGSKDGHLTLGSSWDNVADAYGHVIHIPLGMVKKVKKLR